MQDVYYYLGPPGTCIFPNGFDRGPYIRIFCKGFLLPVGECFGNPKL